MPALRFPDPPLADELVLLRPWTADDIPDKVMSFADQSVQRFSWPLVREYTEMDARGYFVEQEQARRRGDELNFAFADPADPTAVFGGGSVHAVDLAECRAAVGYWLAPDARGRGIATHATQLMAGWAFAGLGLARLELTCGPDNEASQRVALRCASCAKGSYARIRGSRAAAATR
jgi:RimJ/RimL family protein N-acetyltransferase